MLSEIILNSFCIVSLAILWLSADRRRSSRIGSDAVLFRAMLLSTGVIVAVDSLTILFDGTSGSVGRAAVTTSSVLYYAFHTLPLPLSILYADFQLYRERERLTKLGRPLGAVAALLAALAIASPFLNIFFYVDELNRYARGRWFFVFAASQFALSAYLLGHTVANRKRVNRRIFTVLVVYPLPMILAAVLQVTFFGLHLLWPVMTLFLMTVAFNVENRRARTDYLTGTENRRSLDEELERRMRTSDPQSSLYALMADIDKFKSINDSFGHEMGDRALEDVASALLSSVRVDDFVARMGGDEFVILVDTRDAMDIEVLVDRVEGALETLNASSTRPYRLSLSIGRAVYRRESSLSASEFLALLDRDMYERKKARGA